MAIRKSLHKEVALQNYRLAKQTVIQECLQMKGRLWFVAGV